jgi:hypothetical protein
MHNECYRTMQCRYMALNGFHWRTEANTKAQLFPVAIIYSNPTGTIEKKIEHVFQLAVLL